MARMITQYDRQRSSFHPLNGVLGVIQPHSENRASLKTATRDMVTARMALAARQAPPEALQLALMQAYQRHRKFI